MDQSTAGVSQPPPWFPQLMMQLKKASDERTEAERKAAKERIEVERKAAEDRSTLLMKEYEERAAAE